MPNQDNNNQKTYKRETAGHIMTRLVPMADSDSTIGEIEAMIIKKVADFDTINYVYIVGKDHKLKGVISIKEIYRQDKDEPVRKVMAKELISARPRTDQERVVYQALKHNIKALPVVDKMGIFHGVVPSDSILKTLYQETQEDILHLAGVHHSGAVFDNIMKMPLLVSLKHRLPWLLIGLLGGIMIAKIIQFYESTLVSNLIIAAYIPLVIYMASAVGVQMNSLIIRDLAFNPKFNFFKYFIKNFNVVILIGLFSGLVFYAVNCLIINDFIIRLVLSIAMLVAIVSSVFTGLVIPFILDKLKFDPANASGPIGTIIQDMLSVIIYFSVAAWLLT